MIEIIKKILKEYDIDGRTAGAAAKLIDVEAKNYYGKDSAWRGNIPRESSDYIYKIKSNKVKTTKGIVSSVQFKDDDGYSKARDKAEKDEKEKAEKNKKAN